MPDVLITRDGPYDAPYSYELGAREAFEPTTVEGLVDGAGAGGDFKIVCVIRSPDGKVLARVPTAETFSPGDEVAVTFAPFLRAFAAAGTAATFRWCRVACGSGVPSGSIALPQTGTALPVISLDTNDPASYSQTGANTWTIPAVPQMLAGYMLVDGGGLTLLNGDVTCIVNKSGGAAYGPFGQSGTKILTTFFSIVLGEAGEIGGTWRAFAAGTDTHQFDIVATFGAVF